MKAFGTYIKNARIQKGISLRACSDKMGIDKAYLSRIENSQVLPSLEFIKRFSATFQFDFNELCIASGRLPTTFSDRDIEEIIGRVKTSATKKVYAIENEYPIAKINAIAEMESWRKEVYRPVYHIHKWWAQRLGSVFRSIILGICLDEKEDLMEAFYKPNKFSNTIIYDPFMGSGTTIGESLKLGCRAIGRDINPVSYLITKTAFDVYTKKEIINEYNRIEKEIAEIIKSYYKTKLDDGTIVDVLYYFWVKQLNCPKCDNLVDLFTTRIFSKHAYVKKVPQVRSTCPKCGFINKSVFDTTNIKCESCKVLYNQHEGNCKEQITSCPHCKHEFKTIDAVRLKKYPPKHKLYAKMVVLPNGEKEYLPINDFDEKLYLKANAELSKYVDAIPKIQIRPGYNTNQVLNYNYQYWCDMFNDRQLLVLCILANRIKHIEDDTIRNVFICLFSGCLEFNNMFCSFKGEGTGAVRHMFSHHILKPERTPLEANLWGTPKSSGSFSTLFESRILRAIEYKENPFELRPAQQKGKITSEKVYNINEPLYHKSANDFNDFKNKGARLYLSCGDSAVTDIEKDYVDFVITDPPFFDNVNYSELADFFYVWQRLFYPNDSNFVHISTRAESEVQNPSAQIFTNNFLSVLLDIERVLKPEGRLIFTYHHSKNEGWISILVALHKAHFCIINAYPVKSEMSVATPKSQATEPIDMDVILVCKKISDSEFKQNITEDVLDDSVKKTRSIIKELNGSGKRLSKNDIRIIFMSDLIAKLSYNNDLNESVLFFNLLQDDIEQRLNAFSITQISP